MYSVYSVHSKNVVVESVFMTAGTWKSKTCAKVLAKYFSIYLIYF